MAKKKAAPPQEPVPAEPTLEVVSQEEPAQEHGTAPQHVPDRTYSYMVKDEKGVFRRHSFKESQATEDDIMHFVRVLGEVYDRSPSFAKINFMAYAFPPMRRFLREHEPEILAAIMHEPDKAPN